ncbi:hypothetical protein G3570_00035 [Balneolaceae bacterium YR4-1]|uniref:Uncharacterized protein n=1 Tax=Halalkalibaculum roseum TaxID=2709311 RepID=A0A6M1SQM1_9BACT|nr:hypothetical protein [Halalkalibaculum roseum]NGP75002.1 hypothetical protein [Halalkalibaculum roseum]
MMRNHVILSALFMVLMLTASSCTVIGDSGGGSPIDWENGEGIVPADDESLSSEQKERYQLDAEKLAVRYINDRNSTQTEIPQELTDLFYNGLVHIVLSDLPESDEVTETYEVHAHEPAQPHEILVQVDTTASWIDAWRNETTETGYTELDDLVEQFGMTLTEYRELEQALPVALATLRADRVINGHAVGRLFEELEDIESAGYDPITDGSDIRAILLEDRLRFTFEYSFGDCPAGCIGNHRWNFEVFKDGSVAFAGEEGDPLPE